MNFFFCYICLFAVTLAFAKPPNIIVLFADDFGYGDLPSYGHPTSESPNLEHMITNGLRFTQFYSASPVCSPSRASLLTGRQPPRTGVYPKTFSPGSSGGLPLQEITIAEMLKPLGYSTAIIGKWHLGVGKDNKYMPTHQGFDYYYGIPYSHGMCPCIKCFYPDDPCLKTCGESGQYVACPLFKDTAIIEQPTDLTTLSVKYSQEARTWIRKQATAEKPFFLYYAFHQTHTPMFAGQRFRNSTERGPYSDMLVEMDWMVGEVLDELKDQRIEQETLVFFMSDNGPCLRYEIHGGNAGLLKCGKGTTYEGGQRVPAIAYWPGHIKPGKTIELASTLDILPTIAGIVGVPLPDVTLDGVDMAPILFNQEQGLRDSFFYYPTITNARIGLYAVRYRQYKGHYYTSGNGNSGRPTNHDPDCGKLALLQHHDPPLVYDLDQDPSELYPIDQVEYKDVFDKLQQLKDDYETNMPWARSEVLKPTSKYFEPCCNPGCKPLPSCCTCKGNITLI